MNTALRTPKQHIVTLSTGAVFDLNSADLSWISRAEDADAVFDALGEKLMSMESQKRHHIADVKDGVTRRDERWLASLARAMTATKITRQKAQRLAGELRAREKARVRDDFSERFITAARNTLDRETFDLILKTAGPR